MAFADELVGKLNTWLIDEQIKYHLAAASGSESGQMVSAAKIKAWQLAHKELSGHSLELPNYEWCMREYRRRKAEQQRDAANETLANLRGDEHGKV